VEVITGASLTLSTLTLSAQLDETTPSLATMVTS
jgi:hypothetical protein